jgi:hypothetical protein
MIAYMRRGLIPDLGGIWVIPRMIGRRKTAEMLYTAKFASAQELLEAGGLNAVYPPEELEAKTLAMAEEIAAAAPISNKVAKMSWRVTEPLDFEASNDIVASTVLVAGRSEDHRESVKAFFEKRQPSSGAGNPIGVRCYEAHSEYRDGIACQIGCRGFRTGRAGDEAPVDRIPHRWVRCHMTVDGQRRFYL